jgi:hypothetical protein
MKKLQQEEVFYIVGDRHVHVLSNGVTSFIIHNSHHSRHLTPASANANNHSTTHGCHLKNKGKAADGIKIQHRK